MVEIPLKKKWVRTDAWRGYYEYDNSVLEGAFLSGDERGNEGEKRRIKKAKQTLKEHKIPHRFKTARTSNVFSRGWDIIVAPQDVSKAKKALARVV